MLGSLITRCLIMFLGYAYPAFECYKTVEKNRVEIEELRFWCQYWIIVALLTVLERLGDVFISWFPMYGEGKVAIFVYLWYPKIKGTAFVYETLLRPYVSKHETDIDRKLLEFRARAWDLAVCYWQHCAQMGHHAFFQVLQYMAAHSSKFAKPTATETQTEDDKPNSTPAPSKQPSLRKASGKNIKWPPPSTPPATPNGTGNNHGKSQTEEDSAQQSASFNVRLRRSKPIQ